MRISAVLAAIFLMAASLFSTAEAAPVTYKLTGFVSGTVGADSFTNAPIAWTLNADSDDVLNLFPGVFVLPFSDSSITLGAVGTLTPTLDLVAVNNIFIPDTLLIMDDAFSTFVALYAPWLLSYDGVMSIGPLPVVFDGMIPLPTDLGDLLFESAELTLEVDGVPEPATLALVGFGLLGAGAMRRRAKAA